MRAAFNGVLVNIAVGTDQVLTSYNCPPHSGIINTFADIDGDGNDERIQIKPNGEVWAWHNANGL